MSTTEMVIMILICFLRNRPFSYQFRIAGRPSYQLLQQPSKTKILVYPDKSVLVGITILDFHRMAIFDQKNNKSCLKKQPESLSCITMLNKHHPQILTTQIQHQVVKNILRQKHTLFDGNRVALVLRILVFNLRLSTRTDNVEK